MPAYCELLDVASDVVTFVFVVKPAKSLEAYVPFYFFFLTIGIFLSLFSVRLRFQHMKQLYAFSGRGMSPEERKEAEPSPVP